MAIPIPGDALTNMISFDLIEAVYFDASIDGTSYNCPSSQVQICADVECITPLASTDIFFNINPTLKDFDGVTRAILNIMRTNNSMIEEIYITGYTSDASIKTTLKGIIAVCGSAITVTGEDTSQ